MLLVAADRFTHSFISLVPCINIHSWVRIFLLDQFFTFLLLFFIQFISSLMLRRMVWVQKICPVFSRIEWKALPHHRAIPSSPLRQGKWIHNQLSAPFPLSFCRVFLFEEGELPVNQHYKKYSDNKDCYFIRIYSFNSMYMPRLCLLLKLQILSESVQCNTMPNLSRGCEKPWN